MASYYYRLTKGIEVSLVSFVCKTRVVLFNHEDYAGLLCDSLFKTTESFSSKPPKDGQTRS
jgi:hypothetical protein